MKDQNLFSEDEFPYEALARIGLSKEMIQDLPETELTRLRNGVATSPLLLVIDKGGGVSDVALASIFLKRNPVDNKVHHVVIAQMPSIDLSDYPAEIQDALNQGYSVFSKLPLSPIAGTSPGFYQVNRSLNCVMFMPSSEELNNSLMEIINKERVSIQEVRKLFHNGLMTIYKDGNPLTFGIDLNSETGLRIIEGDKLDWRKEAGLTEKYNFGLNGCWKFCKNGGLEYIPEDAYDDEMIEALREANDQALSR